MKIHFVSTLNFQNWDFRTPDDGGIGGSETAHIELAWRLARRGHEVNSYTSIPDDVESGTEWRGTKWFRLEDVDWSKPGVWVLFRSSVQLDEFEDEHPEQIIWMDLQDETVWGPKTEELAKKIDRCICFCSDHVRHVSKNWPGVANKISLSSNGIKVDLIRKLEAEGIPERNPKRLIYASSPDRGLLCAIDIFKKAREVDPELELHAFYGTSNIEKLIESGHNSYKPFVEKLNEAVKTPGVYYHEGVSQPELYKEIMKSGIWLYPTEFNETSCIVCMEMQAMGAIPITNPYWALRDNVTHGVFIQGRPYQDGVVQARYVQAVLALAAKPDLQATIRKPMVFHARNRFNWDRITDQWDSWLFEIETGHKIDTVSYNTQYAFTHRHVTGDILNIGCGPDLCKMKESRGAFNIDCCEIDPGLGIPNPVDLIADARDLPKDLYNKFDTVLLSDILEHMNYGDIVKTLENAKRCLRDNGKIVITWPIDCRQPIDQNMPEDEVGRTSGTWYTENIPGFHNHPIYFESMGLALIKAGLSIKLQQSIDYTFADGYGLVCQCIGGKK